MRRSLSNSLYFERGCLGCGQLPYRKRVRYPCGTKLSIWMRVSLRRLEMISADFWRTR
jgi:hypothetical protein